MGRIRQSRNREVSLLQSAIDAVVMRDKVGYGAEALTTAVKNHERAGIEDPMVHQAAVLAHAVDNNLPIADLPPANPATVEGIGSTATYCASRALKLATAIFTHNKNDEQTYRDELSVKFGSCDARYIEAAEQCSLYFGAMRGQIPYVDYQQLGDFIIDDSAILPSNAVVGVIGDWGTGQEHACDVLGMLAKHNPDVVIHLGDIYYSGVDHEVQGYFFDKWCACLGLRYDKETRHVLSSKPKTFSLAGNHDMYSGGAPFYKMIQQLGQRASFFCLRNKDWQLIGLDTGYNDHQVEEGHFTQLPPRQSDWLKDKFDNRNGRKTVLLSHHQLFSSSELFQDKGDTNTALLADVEPVLGEIALWLWGHEHDLAIFKKHAGLERGRCMGHGAYPVGFDEVPDPPSRPEMLLAPRLLPRGQSFYNNGYAVMQLSGPQAHVTYYALSDDLQEAKFFEEDI